jgi:hypothetical protein
MFCVTLRLHLPPATCVLHLPSIPSLIIFGNEYKKKSELLFHFLQVLALDLGLQTGYPDGLYGIFVLLQALLGQ